MKKVKKLSLLAFLIVFCISVFSPSLVSAKEKVFSLTNAKIGENTETTVVNNFSFKNDTINSDITFHKVGDYVTYELTIKNVTNKNYIISSIKDDNKNKNIIYNYDKNKGTKVNKGECITLLVKAIYKKGETDTSKRNKSLSVKLTINYVDEKDKKGSENLYVNPSTGDNILLFFGMSLSSLLIILILLINKKKKLNKKKFIAYLMILSLVLPFGVNASGIVYKIKFTSNYSLMDKVVVTVDINGKKTNKVIDYNTKLTLEDPTIEGQKFVGWKTSSGKDFDLNTPITEDTYIKAEFIERVALLDIGTNIDLKMKALANDTTTDYVHVDGEDFEIEHIKITKQLPEGYEPSEIKTISTDDSDEPVYIWWDENTKILYWYTEAGKIMLNEDCSHMFEEIEHLQEVDFLKNLDSSKVTTMNSMFAFDQYFESTDGLKYLDTSNVTDMGRMLLYASPDLSKLSEWDVSKVTNMYNMLAGGQFTSLDGLANWNTSKVENMSYLFYACMNLESITGLRNWKTSNVTDMNHMFASIYNENFTTLDGLENFNTSKVTDMSNMFDDARYLTDISAIRNFDVSKVKNMSQMFQSLWYLKDISPITNWNTGSLENASWMFSGSGRISGTINLRGNIIDYRSMFYYTSSNAESTGLTVNYSASVAPIIDDIIATKSENSKVYKGSLLDD